MTRRIMPPPSEVRCGSGANSGPVVNAAFERAVIGALLGTAVGDAIALPFEGLPRRRVSRFWRDGPLTHHFLLGRGACSDDTEHTCMVAQALLAAGPCDDAEAFVARFRHSFAWRLRFWLLGLPAGIGMATLRSILKLWLTPLRAGSGVYSAGNGPAMRSAIIGVCLAQQPDLMRRVVAASTGLTHTDPRAEHGALAIAMAAAMASRGYEGALGQVFASTFEAAVGTAGSGLCALIRQASESAARREPSEQFAAAIGCERGVTGFVMHSVPVALHVWFRHEYDYRSAIETVVRCGGDTDTVAAIVGGIIGAAVGKEGLPADWLHGLCEWPRSPAWIEQLGLRLVSRFADGQLTAPLPLNVALLFLRNVIFMGLVLGHGLRRLLPPY